MIRHGVGCRIEEALYVKKVDEEFSIKATTSYCAEHSNLRRSVCRDNLKPIAPYILAVL
jgi:hypothetical protein